MKQYILSIKIKGPFVSSSSTIDKFGCDNPTVKNHEGKPIILGTQVLGKLKQYGNFCNDLPQGEGKEELNNQRNKIFVSDLVINGDYKNKKNFVRIKINDEGVVEDGALQVIESVLEAGEIAEFSGDLIYFGDEKDIEEEVKEALEEAYQIGAFKTIGYGKIEAVEVLENVSSFKIETKQLNDISYFSLKFKDLFCIAKPKTGSQGNLFESEEIISGAVLKGAFASLIDSENSLLKDNLDKIYFSHAKPTRKPNFNRLNAIPITASLDNNKNIVYYEDEPEKISTNLKSDDLTHLKKELLGEELNIPRTMRVRSAIDKETRRSKDEMLFAYECIEPFDFNWNFYISFEQLDDADKNQVKEQFIQTIKFGFYNIGKTDARAEINYAPSKENDKFINIEYDKKYKLILQTDAEIIKANNNLSEDGKLKTAYEDYFDKYDVTLIDFYSEEQLVGGEYFYHKFIKPNSDNYTPRILTKAGSVFVIKTNNQSDIDRLNQLQELGLDSLETDYKKSPYVKFNGYGEIIIKLK